MMSAQAQSTKRAIVSSEGRMASKHQQLKASFHSELAAQARQLSEVKQQMRVIWSRCGRIPLRVFGPPKPSQGASSIVEALRQASRSGGGALKSKKVHDNG